jgi:hypothetical protein
VELELDRRPEPVSDGARPRHDRRDQTIKSALAPDRRGPAGAHLPILLGFGMPAHAEMASPILPATTRNVKLVNDIPDVAVISSAEPTDCQVETVGKHFTDVDLKKSPGSWMPK